MLKKEFLLYIFFALISMLINYLIQVGVEWALLSLNGKLFGTTIYNNILIVTLIKIPAATIGAFVFKYICDKLIIFKADHDERTKEGFLKVVLYGIFAVFTTLLFWITQLSFKIIFDLEYVGLFVGLAAGYTIKYILDSKYVFKKGR